MKIEREDLQILSTLHNLKKDETVTVYSVAEKLYPNAENVYKKNANCNKVISRFRKLQDYGLVEIEKDNGKNYYNLFMDRCFVGRLNLNNPKINGKFMFLLVTDKKSLQDKWTIFEL